MKVTLSWLKEFAPDLEQAAAQGNSARGNSAQGNSAQADLTEQLAWELSDLGLSVEEVKHLGPAFKGVVVAKVLALRSHPDADRIQLVDVDDGTGEPRQICCGAFNMAVGDLVPLATEGAVVSSGLEIERRKLRGQWSEGMLCSPEELDLAGNGGDSGGDGDDDDGILILPPNSPLGTDLAEALELESDVLFDLEVNPNRPDAMSVAGVARDLAARLKIPFAIPQPQVKAHAPANEAGPSNDAGSANPLAPVEINLHEPGFCAHFTVRLLTDIAPGSSPGWLTQRLLALGMRPVNPLVDISNYVMLELGQPTHAFDFDQIPTGSGGAKVLAVRMARQGEQLETLDGTVRTLDTADGVIVDCDDVALSLAGVMGGASTEISDTTRVALVEAAWWDPMTISRTSRRHGLRSEASARFERGVDPEIAELALLRFAELAETVGVAKLSEGQVRADGDWPVRDKVTVRPQRVKHMSGLDLSPAEIAGCIEPMGFETEPAVGEPASGGPADPAAPPALQVTIPSWRLDCETEIDIIEEIVRGHGYYRIPKLVPLFDQIGGLSPRQQTRRQISELLAGMGLCETISLPFLAPGDLETAGEIVGEAAGEIVGETAGEAATDALVISNPLVVEESVLRTTLRPGLLKQAAYNQARRQSGARLFELGHVFSGAGAAAGHNGGVAELPTESEHLAVMLAGAQAEEAVRIWLKLCQSLKLSDVVSMENSPRAGLHPGRAAEISLVANKGVKGKGAKGKPAKGKGTKSKPAKSKSVEAVPVGVVGEIDPEVLRRLDIAGPVAWLELNLDQLLDFHQSQPPPSYKSPSKFPSSDIDLAFWVSSGISAAEVRSALLSAGGDSLVSVELFDVYMGDGATAGDGTATAGDGTAGGATAANARSLAFRLRFESQDRTLTDEEVAQLRQACIKAAQALGDKTKGTATKDTATESTATEGAQVALRES